MEQNVAHINWLDTAKGLGIILVVIGHTMFPVHTAIELFHMPLFFFLAGLTIKPDKDIGGFLIKKIDRIFVPYVFFSLLVYIACLSLQYSGPYFDVPLWFLQSIFIALILCKVFVTFFNKQQIVLVTCVMASIGYATIKFQNGLFPYDLDFSRAIRAAVFILCGYLTKDYILKKQKAVLNWIYACMTTVLFTIFCYVSIFKFGATGSFYDGNIFRYNILVYYLTSFAGILMIITISKCIDNIRLFRWLGFNSMIIMVVHYPFFDSWWNPFIASTTIYANGGFVDKILLALISYLLGIIVCIPFICLFKNYLPKLTGYSNLLYKR